MFYDIESFFADVASDLRDVLSAAFPGTEFSVTPEVRNEQIRLEWVDGPTKTMVMETASAYVSIEGELRIGERLLAVRAPLLSFYRGVSYHAAALLVGCEVAAAGTPPLPPEEVYYDAGIDSGISLPYEMIDVRELAASLENPSFRQSHPLFDLVRRAHSAAEAADLSSSILLLKDLAASDAAAVECFATLCMDQTLRSVEEAALYAAAGGWALTHSLVR